MPNLAGCTVVLLVLLTVAWRVAGEMWPAVIVLTVGTLLGALASGLGPERAAEGHFAMLFLITVLPYAGSLKLAPAVGAVALGATVVVAPGLVIAGAARLKARRPGAVAPASPGDRGTGAGRRRRTPRPEAARRWCHFVIRAGRAAPATTIVLARFRSLAPGARVRDGRCRAVAAPALFP